MDGNLEVLIANVGFPIAISMYLLIRIEGKLTILTDSINELSKNILNMRKGKQMLSFLLIYTLPTCANYISNLNLTYFK